MCELLVKLCEELGPSFDTDDPEQLHGNIAALADQVQLLVGRINQNPLVHAVLPDIGIPQRIKAIECLSRETKQIYRNLTAAALARVSLDKEIKRRKRILRKLKRVSSDQSVSSSASKATAAEDDAVVAPKSSRLSFRLSPIRESIPLPPPPVNFRFNFADSSSPPSLDTDEPLEFDLV